MKNKELQDFQIHHLNLEGEKKLIAKIKRLLEALISELQQLPENTNQSTLLENFKKCILNINYFEDEIETVERESIFENIYAIGKIVGLDPTSEYAEEWRGDW
jgi:hypothetical protein